MQEVRTKNLKHRYFSDRKVFVGQVQLKDKRLLSPKRVEPQACHSLTVLITSQCTCNDLADDKDDDHDKHYFVFVTLLNIPPYCKLKRDHNCLFVCLRQLGSKPKYMIKMVSWMKQLNLQNCRHIKAVDLERNLIIHQELIYMG